MDSYHYHVRVISKWLVFTDRIHHHALRHEDRRHFHRADLRLDVRWPDLAEPDRHVILELRRLRYR